MEYGTLTLQVVRILFPLSYANCCGMMVNIECCSKKCLSYFIPTWFPIHLMPRAYLHLNIQYVTVIVLNAVFNATAMKIARLDWHVEGTTVNRSLKALKKSYMTAVKNVRNIVIARLNYFCQ